MTSPSLRDPKLAELYQRTPGAVAFVDESYRAHPLGPERAFYSASTTRVGPSLAAVARSARTESARASWPPVGA